MVRKETAIRAPHGVRFHLVSVVTVGVLLGSAGVWAAPVHFVANPMNCQNEVPCNTCTLSSHGAGAFTLETTTGMVSYYIKINSLSAPETASHVHGPAPACVNAGVLFGLPLGFIKNGSYGPVNQVQMSSGQHYVNVHTSQLPGGEIRGQILRVVDPVTGCCLPSAAGGTVCVNTTAANCQAMGGVVQPAACAGATTACCLPTGACVDVDPVCCDDLGGTPQAAGTSCLTFTCPPPQCGPNPAQPARCLPVTCPNTVERCLPRCVRFNPATGQTTVLDCECMNPNACHVDVPLPGPEGDGNPCVVPDAGGTVVLPPAGCQYLSPDEVHMIIDGLPPGTTIQVATIHRDFICHKQGGTPSVCSFPPPIPGVDCDEPGGSLGGEKECAASMLQLNMQGTGMLAGFNRMIQIQASFETHTAPRMPGDPVQSFDTDMFRLFGQLPPGDPDFDLLRITAGTNFGLPSPGHTTLTRLPGGNWAVDSFFDITYRIDFVGAPGGPLAGMSGSTTGTIRMATGGGPSCVGGCPPGFACERQQTVQPDGTIDMCCVCVPQECGPDPAQPDRCLPVACPNLNEECLPRCVRVNPTTGQTVVLDCDCRGTFECHVAIPGAGSPEGTGNPCVVPDAGGTVVLPPPGCGYLSPDDVHVILDGLPPGTTIQIGTQHLDFICPQGPPGVGLCSFPTPGTSCSRQGGSLGGEQECFLSTLQMQLAGTGMLAGYNRNLNMLLECETHIAPRIPGQPVQSFDTDMFRLMGQLPPGDPDFDLLRITAGTNFGLPSPGHTTLTQLPGGNWAVDSFFDITYRIDFVGAPGGPLAGMSGSTTATIRMATGANSACVGSCPPGMICREQRTVNPNGTIDICCDCVPACKCRGDVSGNCVLNGGDVAGFVKCFLGATNPLCACADMNGDGMVDILDVNPFVTVLLQMPPCPPNCVPGP